MGRVHSIERLPVDQQSLINNIIRAHHYVVLDNILEDIKAQGLDFITRSTLGRYVPKLKAQDHLKADPSEDTIVTLVERSTGKVLVLKTGVAAELVAAKIAKMKPLSAIS